MHTADTATAFNILSIDGGGAKGFYSLGFLRELEAALGCSLASHFHAIYGTSTGAIIASQLALGKSATAVLELYTENVPGILGAWGARGKTAKLKAVSKELYKDVRWSDFKTRIGIVATNWTNERPLVFKNKKDAAHGMKETFVEGFGCAVSDAVRASCSATPYFKPCMLKLENDGIVEARDGGFCANNPSLVAIADALNPLGIRPECIRLLSLGVGNYPAPERGWAEKMVYRYTLADMLNKTLYVSANTTEIQVKQLFPKVPCMRVSDHFAINELAMDFLESDLRRLDRLVQKGRDSFSMRGADISTFWS